jgi:fucose permease
MVIFVVSGMTAQFQARVSARVLLTAGLGLVSVGMLALLLATATSSWVMTLPGLIIAAVGTGLFNPALSAVVLREATHDDAGLAAGVNDTARQGGIAIGVAGLGALIPAASARGVMDKAAFVAGLHHATLVAALVAAVGAAATGWLVDRNLRDRREDVVPVDEAVAEEAVPSLV